MAVIQCYHGFVQMVNVLESAKDAMELPIVLTVAMRSLLNVYLFNAPTICFDGEFLFITGTLKINHDFRCHF